MREKPYYSVRTGKHPTGGRLDWAGLVHLFASVYTQLYDSRHFAQVLGYDCVDAGFVPGSAGSDTEAFFFRKLKKRNLWPILERIGNYSEDDLFDVIELLNDCASKGVTGREHTYGGCGWHYETFNRPEGQNEFRAAVNDILCEYGPGYRLTPQGEVVVTAPRGLADLERAPAPPADRENVQARVDAAISKFRRRGASIDDRKDAVRDLADILEFLRPRVKGVLTSKDESDLFELANKFGIRHHNERQQTKYDKAIWYSWMFYYYLATIHATTRLIQKAPADEAGARPGRSK
jgi:hypothetical protein